MTGSRCITDFETSLQTKRKTRRKIWLVRWNLSCFETRKCSKQRTPFRLDSWKTNIYIFPEWSKSFLFHGGKWQIAAEDCLLSSWNIRYCTNRFLLRSVLEPGVGNFRSDFSITSHWENKSRFVYLQFMWVCLSLQVEHVLIWIIRRKMVCV